MFASCVEKLSNVWGLLQFYDISEICSRSWWVLIRDSQLWFYKYKKFNLRPTCVIQIRYFGVILNTQFMVVLYTVIKPMLIRLSAL